MGAFESTENYDYAPPPPSHSTLFVVRNGRYEPQNLMPVLPRSDILDFDGFAIRRGNGPGCLNARPPEMKQASLVKNPLSIRRDSARCALPAASTESGPAAGDADASVASPMKAQDRGPTISFVFDAVRAGTMKIFLLVTEIEVGEKGPGGQKSIILYPRGATEGIMADMEKADEAAGGLNLKGKEKAPRDGASTILEILDTKQVEPGLGQTYQSPALDLTRWPAASLCFDPNRPRDMPIAVKLEAESTDDEEASIQYTYISLQTSTSDDADKYSAQIFAQKLQYNNQCFVLHDVFGVCSKATLDSAVDEGNPDCIICLSEPRDTAVLPCRHMCFCSYCAGIVRLQCDRCPVCRCKVESLLQFKKEEPADPKTASGIGGGAGAAALLGMAKQPEAGSAAAAVAAVEADREAARRASSASQDGAAGLGFDSAPAALSGASLGGSRK